ncbi:elicitin [Phytophthora sojae]|uniref:Elicitin n=1 Tax=Phytophthora sojae (strain P6497) TaxID=1094619 RepID=G4YGQ5_PHYSP|nr:elicitin [Phytophthora sojae]EGZ30773.1 elicitin [Phytophthora sojae]|eukprot:XP_009518048.1 elicitin [Phytophthora sojae]
MRSPALALLLVAALGALSCLAAGAEAVSQAVDVTVSDTQPLVSDNRVTRDLQELTAIAQAQVGSKTFALVDSYDCDNGMVTTVRKFFKANDDTFDTCVADSGYQMYPYTGIVPDAKTVTGLINSNACMGIVTAVVLLNMPPCELDDLPMRAACETILYYSIALRHGASAPSSDQFNELMTWRRDVNLAKAANKPHDAKSATYAEFTKNVRKALTTSKVTVMDNFTVILDDEEADSIEMKDGKQPSFVSTNSSMDYFVGKVTAAENGVDDGPVKGGTATLSSQTVAATQETSGTSSVTTSAMTIAMLLVLAVAGV